MVHRNINGALRYHEFVIAYSVGDKPNWGASGQAGGWTASGSP